MTKQKLESMHLTVLAVLCGNVADNASAYSTSISSKARKMKNEWASLQTISPGSDYQKHQAVEAQKVALKKQMVEFLWTLEALKRADDSASVDFR